MMRLFSRFDLKFFLNSVGFFSMLMLLLALTSSLSSGKFLLASRFLNLIQKVTLRVQGANISRMFTPILLTLFFYLILSNYFSVFSFVHPLGSQMRLVLYLSLTFWASFVVFILVKNLARFIGHCVPEGTPLPLVSFLFLIELVRQIIRPLTLTVRLVANILAGHLLIILLSQLALGSIFSFLPYVILNGVEIFVAFIQAYIIITIITLYYGEVS